MGHVSPGPRCYPGRSVFPSPVGGLGFPARPFRPPGGLSADSHSPPRLLVYLTLGTPSTQSALPGSESRAGWLTCPPSPRAPWPLSGVTGSGGDVSHHLTGRYPSVLATTGSCAGSFALLSASQLSWSFRSWPVAVGPGWASILPDLISANPSPDVWPPIPAGPSVRCSFLPSGLRPSPC